MSHRSFPFGYEPVDHAPPAFSAPESCAEKTAPIADLLPATSPLPFYEPPPAMMTQPLPAAPPLGPIEVAPPVRAVEVAPLVRAVAPQRMSFETGAALVLLVLDIIAITIAVWGR